MKRSSALLAFVLIIARLAPAFCEDGAPAAPELLDAALARALAELDAEKEALSRETGQFERESREKAAAIETLLDDCERASARIFDLSAEADRIESTESTATVDLDESAGQLAELRDFVAKRTLALALKVRLGIPHAAKQDRLASLGSLAQAAEEGSIGVETMLDSYFGACLDEVGLGSTTEVFALRILPDDGSEFDADCLRVGKVFCAYRARGSARSGVLVRGADSDTTARWAESADAAAIVEKAVSGGGTVMAPMDVTLDLTADRMAVSKDLIGTIAAGGVVMIPLALVALAALALVLERTATLFLMRPRSRRIENSVVGAARRGDIEGALRSCASIGGPVAAALLAGLTVRAAGRTAVEEAIQESATRSLPRLERSLAGIAALAAVAPLLGLLGTVTGMISTFDVITIFGTGDPRLLSGGISEALVTTEVGLIIAIPLVLAHRVLSGVADRATASIEILGSALVNALFFTGAAAGGINADAAQTGSEGGAQ